MNQDWLNALLGGVLIGIAVTLMLYLNGRVTGISGIINGLLSPIKKDIQWRAFFIGGLILGGIVLRQTSNQVFENSTNSSLLSVVIAGLLVGFGTVMGSGCTSGHGVCGMSRLSPRSIVATTLFIASGVAAVFIFKNLGVY